MIAKLGLQTIFRSILYLILIFVSIKALIALMDEQSAFEEKNVENGRKLPSFTLCLWPGLNQPDNPGNNAIESFEDVASAIKNVESKFTIKYSDYDPMYEKKIQKIEKYNDTLDSVWYFVPKISIRSPSEDAICLIWRPSTESRPKRQIKVHICNLFQSTL